jgi:hypothetical protein
MILEPCLFLLALAMALKSSQTKLIKFVVQGLAFVSSETILATRIVPHSFCAEAFVACPDSVRNAGHTARLQADIRV